MEEENEREELRGEWKLDPGIRKVHFWEMLVLMLVLGGIFF